MEAEIERVADTSPEVAPEQGLFLVKSDNRTAESKTFPVIESPAKGTVQAQVTGNSRQAWSEFGDYEPFVDEHVVARFLDLEPRRVLEMARAGELPAHPIGRTRKTWRFRLSEIDAHFTARRQPVAAKMPVAVPGAKGRNRLG